ncbi:MAG TPA: peptidyl-prolyl cis-trans isomerase [Acidobacteriaceae bacterium]|nr:peptidyl-prolyl cis-trans isomerase [Acidobacteriaceae bacterium]
MIRFLQKDNRVVKIIFIVIISVATITMVITLVPGIFADSDTSSDTYATVHSGGLMGRFFGTTTTITTPEVQQVAERIQQQKKYPDMVLPYLMPQAAQALIQREVLLQEANRLGLQVGDADLRRAMQTGPFAQALFPNGQFIGEDGYANFVQNYFRTSIQDFESQVKKELEINRLQAMVTGGITVSDQDVRDTYRQQGTKIKFDYAVINSEDLRKQINPTDAELQAFFKQNAARYKTAIPETRKLAYIALNQTDVPSGAPAVTSQQVEQYYQGHQKDYQVPDEVKVRHILIKVPTGADAKTDAAAKQKAEDLLKQIKGGADFAALAKANSDDPGSKEQGGELGMIQRGVTVPAFEKAAFALPVGKVSDVIKTQFGYHILEVEEKQTAHLKPLEEVKAQIVATLTRQQEADQQAAFAQQLATEAGKSGLAKTAEAHHLQVVTTDYVPQNAVLSGLPDGAKLLTQAFSAKPGSAPQVSSTGEGFAVFQVEDSKPAHAPTFEEYKSHLVDDFREQQLPQLLARKTNELADKAHAENNLAQAAKEVGATIKSSDLVGRTGQVPDIGDLSTAAPDLFDLKVGQISKAINTGHSGIVAKIDDKQEPTSEETAKNLDATRESLLAERREQMFAVFVTALTERYEKAGGIRMNKRAQTGLAQSMPS